MSQPSTKKTTPRTPVVRVAPVNKGRNTSTIAFFVAAAVVAVGIISFAGYEVYQNGLTWRQRADGIDGIVDFHKKDPASLQFQQHAYGPLTYKYSPPAGGESNPNWQRCLGDVYPAAIADEHAVHSLEDGAIWITYNPDLPAAQVEQLAKKVRGNDFMLMSPYPGLSRPISIQAWGYQLKVDKASDGRIDDFIKDLKVKAANEPGQSCSTGDFITATGTTPHDVQPQDSSNSGG
jgi:hypothetical protein